MCTARFLQYMLTTLVCFAGLSLAAEPQRVEEGGVAMEFSFDQQDDSGAALAQLTLRDAHSGAVLPGARPAAWMVARRSEQVANELSCDDKANQLSIGSLGGRADVDMNAYRLVTLNQDNTVAFINPMVSLQNSKLEALVQLPAAGYDWVFAPRHQRLVVSLRDAGALAVIDTVTRRIVALLPLGADSLPTRLALDPDGNRVWVGLDGRPEVALVDLVRNAETARVAVGKGLHTLVADADTPWLFVTNTQDNTITRVERSSLETAAPIAAADTPVAAAWSLAAQRLVVIGTNGGQLDLIDPAKPGVTGHVKLARGIAALRLFERGRYALVANPLAGEVSLIDLATLRVIDTLKIAGKPDQIALSGGYAYVRSQGNAQVHVINLAQARLGKLQSAIVPMGRRAPLDAPEAINDAASIMAAAPEGNGMLLANAADGYIYRYVEGMMAPIGSFSNYRRQARALRVLDESLSEREPGHFQATVRVPHSGRYDVIVRNLRPAITACFTVNAKVAANGRAEAPAAPVPRLISVHPTADHRLAVEFSLHVGEHTIGGVQDAVVLAFSRSGAWQGRSPARAVEGARYQALFSGVPVADIELLVQAPSQEIWFNQARMGRVRWPLEESPARDAQVAVEHRDAIH